MQEFFEHLFASFWNRWRDRRGKADESRQPGLSVGFEIIEGSVSRRRAVLGAARRTMHVAVLGKTGSGKSSLLRQMGREDIEAGDHGFIWFDLHGDATPFLLRVIAEVERKLGRHLSDRVVLIAPGDPDVSVGFNPLECGQANFRQIAEFAAILKARWGLDHFGARTDELLRNVLFTLAANGFTLLEVALFLTHAAFRAACLKKTPNAEVQQYFELRYNKASDAMRAVLNEPVLNKLTAFVADPSFRHMLGQAHSTFSMREAMDRGYWVIVDLSKGKLGEHALTIASLLFAVVKSAIFTRERRSLFTIYADEIQNLVAADGDIETVLSEARKFGVSIVSANQFLDQYPAAMRAAILSVGTHAFFQLSSTDATQVSQMLDGGKSMAELLKNLPQRRFVLKSGAERWKEVAAHDVEEPKASYADLVKRIRAHCARPRVEIEREIGERQSALQKTTDEVLNGWD